MAREVVNDDGAPSSGVLLDVLDAVAAMPPHHVARHLPLAVHAGHVGSAYAGELMVIGRALNGGSVKVGRAELDDPRTRCRAVEKAVQQATSDAQPLQWVMDHWGQRDGYNTARSAFWRLTKAVFEDACDAPTDGRWASRLACSNLYRISPGEKGNPTTRMCAAQLEGCQRLLRLEIAARRPRRLLFLTGGWFGAFSDALGFEAVGHDPGGLVEQWGTVAGVRAVVAQHPQGKNEREMRRRIAERWAPVYV